MTCNEELCPNYFSERFRTNCCISPTIFKKPAILAEIVGFLKIISEIQ